MKKRNVWIELITAAILGVLIYAPLVPIQSSGMIYTFSGLCYFCYWLPPHVNSITMQFLGFGTQYYGSNYGGVSFIFGGDVGFGALMWADLLVALAVITVGLAVCFLYSKDGVRGASFQLSLGALGILAPTTMIVLGVPPAWMSVLVATETVIVGAVLVLTAIVELWWFGWSKQHEFVSQSQELEMRHL